MESRQRDSVRPGALPNRPPARVERRRRPDGRHDSRPATGEDVHRWPHFLPDGRHFFYTAVTGPCCPPSEPSVIRVGSLDATGPDITVASGGVIGVIRLRPCGLRPRRHPDGAAVRSRARQLKGDAFRLPSTSPERQAATWVHRSRRTAHWCTDRPDGAGVTVDMVRSHRPCARNARRHGAVRQPRAVTRRTSRRRRAGDRKSGKRRHLVDRYRPQCAFPPDRRSGTGRVAGVVARRHPHRVPVLTIGAAGLRASDVDNGTGADELLLAGPGNFTMTPSGWSADGRFIAYTTRGSNVWVLPLFGDRKPFALAETPFTEGSAVFSPDGRWIAYTSNEGGQPNVYVQPFPGPGAKSQMSRDGGSHPVWRADGKELFYLGADGTMMAVPIGAARSFDAGLPQAQFPANAPRA